MKLYSMAMAVLCALSLGLSGCAGIPYEKNMRGIICSRESPHDFEIRVIGNGLAMSQKTANDYAYLRAADAALDNGYKYFEVLRGPQGGPITSRSQIGSTTLATGTVYGGVAYVSGTTAPTYSRASVSYGTLSIYVYNTPRANARPDHCYDAAEVRVELRKKYHIKG